MGAWPWGRVNSGLCLLQKQDCPLDLFSRFSLLQDGDEAVGSSEFWCPPLKKPGSPFQPFLPALLQDGDEGVAVESCEFWSAFCESQIEREVLRPFLPRLLPVLLKNMVSGRLGGAWVEHLRASAQQPQFSKKLDCSHQLIRRKCHGVFSYLLIKSFSPIPNRSSPC